MKFLVNLTFTVTIFNFNLNASWTQDDEEKFLVEEEYHLACEAAVAPEHYGEFDSEIPSPFRKAVSDYKNGWKKFCKGKGQSNTSCANFSRELEIILKLFWELSTDIEMGWLGKSRSDPTYFRPTKEERVRNRERHFKFHDLSRDHFTKFIPAFKHLPRADGPDQYDEPSMEALARIAMGYGSKEDKIFYSDYPLLIGKPWERGSPWREYYEASAVFIGCLRFKKFDWVANFKRIDRMKQELNEISYLEKVHKIEKEMLRELNINIPGSLCACGPKEEVLDIYNKLFSYFSNNEGYSMQAPKMEKIIKAINVDEIVVTNNYEKHCGGG